MLSEFDIIEGLSNQIAINLKAQKNEEYYPQRSADQMDDFIKRKQEKVNSLRRIRQELVELFAEPQ